MFLKTPARSKHASLPGIPDFSRGFLKDWQRLTHSGRYGMARLNEVMAIG